MKKSKIVVILPILFLFLLVIPLISAQVNFTTIPSSGGNLEWNEALDDAVSPYDFDASSNATIDTWSINSTDFLINSNGVVYVTDWGNIDLGLQVLEITVNDTEGSENSTIWTLNIIQNNADLQIDFLDEDVVTQVTSPIDEGTVFYVQISGGDYLKTYRNGTEFSIGSLQNLPAGTYNYSVIRDASFQEFYVYNYAEKEMIINAVDNEAPQFHDFPDNITVEYDDISEMNSVIYGAGPFILSDDSGNGSITMTVNDSLFTFVTGAGDPEGYFFLQFNSQPSSTGVHLLNITANDSSGNIKSILFEVNITQNTEVLNLTFGDNDTPPVEFPNQNKIGVSQQPFNVILSPSSGFTLYRNGTQISSGNIYTEQTLEVGYYNFTMIRNDPNDLYVNDYLEKSFEVYDDEAPQFITIPADTSYEYNAPIQISGWNATDNVDALDDITWEVNDSVFGFDTGMGQPYLINNGKPTVGVHVLNITATDTSGNINWTLYQLTITPSTAVCEITFWDSDLIDAVRVYSPIEENSSLYVNFNCEEANYYLNGSSVSQTINYPSGLSAGTYNFSASRNSANYVNYYEEQILVVNEPADTTAPVITTSSSGISLEYGELWGAPLFDATDNVAIDTWKVNNSLFSMSSFDEDSAFLEVVSEPLASGVYVLNITVNDTSGNIDSKIFTVTITQSTSHCDVLFDKSSPQEEGTTFTVWTNCDSSFTLLKNGIPISNDTVQTLVEGTYNFSVFRTDTNNYVNVFDDETFVVSERGTVSGGSGGGTGSSVTTLSEVRIQAPSSVLFGEDGEIEIEIYKDDDKLYDPSTLPIINVVENVNVAYELIRENAGKYKILFNVPFVEGLNEITFEISVSDGGVTINNEAKISVSESTAIQNFVKTIPEKSESLGSWLGSNLEKILVGVVAIVLIVLTFIFSGRKT